MSETRTPFVQIANGFATTERIANPVDPAKFLKIYRYVPDNHRDIRIPPLDLDFTVALDRKLNRVREFDKQGRLTRANYYADDIGDDLIVRLDFVYELDVRNFPASETRILTWFCNDDSAHDTQKIEVIQYNDQLAKINMLERWRSNQIRILKMRAIELLIYTSVTEGDTQAEQTQDAIKIGQAFLATHKIAFLNYVEDAHPGIISVLSTAPDMWLDNVIPHIGISIREYLVQRLT